MRLPSERYKTHGELSPLAIYTARMFRVVIIIALLVLCRRAVPDTGGKCLAASITPEGDQITGSFTYPADREYCPATVHAVWTDALLYLSGGLGVFSERFFRPEERFVADQFGYVIYSKTDPKMGIYAPNGELIFEHSGAAWPRLAGSAEWIFLFTGDQSGVAFLDRQGGEMGGGFQQFASMVTAWAYTEADQSAVLGMMDGSIEKISVIENRSLWRIEPPAGSLPVIKGLAAALSGVVAVSGSDPEYISMIDHKGQVLWNRKTEGDLRTRVMVCATENFAVTHTRDTAVILCLDTGRVFAALKPIADERITWISVAESPRALYLSVSQGSRTTIYHIAANGRVRDCAVVDSPWAELALTADVLLAITTRDALNLYQNPGEAE
ncbi:MAG: hypothetical protein LBC99_03385 [Spirochaetota bacterium]|jgi:hypothetical protein|nr:hypothetical protein [Spirochaetota bacterium]